MAVFLAPIINSQQESANGAPLSGGFVEVYLAGTSTPATTYSDKAGVVANTNPIVLNTLGVNTQGAVWLTGGSAYKFIIKDSTGVVQRTIDNVSGINDNTLVTDQWVSFLGTPTYVSSTSFTLVGDQTQIFQVGRRLKTTNTGGTVYGTVRSSAYSAPNTTVTVSTDSGVLDSGLSVVAYGVISPDDTSMPMPFPATRNLLINGNFALNQRSYVSGTATGAANQYTLDRWRVVTSGQSITFGAASPDRVVTCPAGGLEQVVEGLMIVGGVYVLSWTGTATATVNGVAIANGSRTAALPANTNVTIRFSNGTVDRAQFEPTYVTPFERRHYSVELLMARRYYYRNSTPTQVVIASGLAYSATNAAFVFQFPVSMRTVPSLTSTNLFPTNGAGGLIAPTGSVIGAWADSALVQITVAAGLTLGQASLLYAGNGSGGFIAFDAEI